MTTANPHLGGFTLLPPPPNVCQVCARNHKPDWPHDAQSLYYQYHFFGEHGRWPTWADALAHCSEAMRAAWTARLAEFGVEVPQVEESRRLECLRTATGAEEGGRR